MRLKLPLLTVLAFGCTAASAFDQYKAYDLGALGGPSATSKATAIDRLGTVVGNSDYSTGFFVLNGGAMQPVEAPFGYKLWEAWGISSRGVISGVYNSRPAIYRDGAISYVGALSGPSAGAGCANAVNSSGVVAGYCFVYGYSHAFVSDGTGDTDLNPLLGTWSDASAINDAGVIVGSCSRPGGSAYTQAFILPKNSTTPLFILFRGDGYDTYATAINGSGLVVGYGLHSPEIGGTRGGAFKYQDGLLTELGTLGGKRSTARGLNEAGAVVGGATDSDGVMHAYVYANNTMTDLAPALAAAGFTGESEATAINDMGYIVGHAATESGYSHAFVIVPLLTTYAEWASSYFTSPDPLIRGPLADPEGSGVPNLHRYAFKLPAHGPIDRPTTMELRRTEANTNLVIQFTRSSLATDLTYVVESSSDLSSWSVRSTLSPGMPEMQTVMDTETTTAASRRFLRVVVQLE